MKIKDSLGRAWQCTTIQFDFNMPARFGMTFVGVNIFLENMVFGAVLIAAVAITIDRSKIAVIK